MKITQFPQLLQERIRSPRFRGKLTKTDSAETQLGLLESGNGEGKAYLLVEPSTGVVQKARFLSFGRLKSIAAMDLFCEKAIDKNILELNSLGGAELTSSCEGMEEGDFDFLPPIAEGLAKALPDMIVEEPIEDKPGAYKRKEKNDMNDIDLEWLPLGAPQKIAKLQKVIDQVMPDRTEYLADKVELYNVQRDLTVQLKFAEEVASAHRPLIVGFLNSGFREELHPEITVEEVK
jgi:NifU-like protein involved in Fe-S cluster formation